MSNLVLTNDVDAREILAASTAELATRLSYLRSVIGPVAMSTAETGWPERPPSDPVWLDCRELTTNGPWLKEVVGHSAGALRTDDLMVSASLFVQGYAYRLFAFAVGCLTLSGVIIDEHAASMAIGITRGRPSIVSFLQPGAAVLTGVQDLETTLQNPAAADECLPRLIASTIDGHLRPLIENLRSEIRVGERLLWGNVAASVATAFRTMEGLLGPWVKPLGLHFLEIAPLELQNQGAYVSMEHNGLHGWFWERTNCCLYDRISPDIRCADCSRTPLEERRRNYLDSLTN